MRPLILISNDDGVQAKGINELTDVLSAVGDVVVMAPDRARSGAGCSITAHEPLRFHVHSVRPGVKICSCNGTPVDCVKLALEKAVDRKPDLVVGGINHGDNSSVSVHYSGTMGIVFEGCMKGIPSIGFSLCDFDSDADFTATRPYIREMAERVLRDGLPAGVCLNVNFPRHEGHGYKGVKICRMAKGAWGNEWFEAVHPRGGTYFWLTGTFKNEESGDLATDACALEHNYVAVTPVQVDMTAYDVVSGLKDWETL